MDSLKTTVAGLGYGRQEARRLCQQPETSGVKSGGWNVPHVAAHEE